MKEIYESPIMEVSLFEESDILTASSGGPIELPILPIWNG